MFAVIFEVHPADGKRDAYLAQAAELKPVIETMDGFIDNERFESRGRTGWVLSLSTWRDEKSVIRWRTQVKHHLTQKNARSGIFSDYHLRVGEITADSHPPVPLREERFDTTETGASKFCTIAEVTPQDQHALPRHDEALFRMIGLDRAAPSLNEVSVYDSIYNPGKVLVLGGWMEPDAAALISRGAIAGVPAVRHRGVRIIRDYGMFDRRETPQYYPDVRPVR